MHLWPWPAGFEVDRRKLRLYLLNLAHPRERAKARFFVGVGFDRDDVEPLRNALLVHASLHNFTGISVARYGLTFVFEGMIATPRGGERRIRTVWQLPAMSDGIARLVTAVPL